MLDRLTTPRLTIRKFKPSDMDGLFRVLSDPEVMRYVEPPFSFKRTEEFVKQYGLCEEPKIFALIYDKSKSPNSIGQIIGHVIFHPYPRGELGSQYLNPYEIGFVIAREFWRQGIAGEITENIIDCAKCVGIDALVLECDALNTASIRIAEKYGFIEHIVPNDENKTLVFVRRI